MRGLLAGPTIRPRQLDEVEARVRTCVFGANRRRFLSSKDSRGFRSSIVVKIADRYRLFNHANTKTMEKVSIGSLQINVPYLIMKMSETQHPEHGRSIKIILRDAKKVQMFSSLPPRFVKNIDKVHLEGFAKDIAQNRPPFIMFKGMKGKAFDICLLQFSLDIAAAAMKGEPVVPPAQDDVEEAVNDDLSWLDDAVKNK